MYAHYRPPQTFIIAVKIPDVFPAIVANDVDNSKRIERSDEDFKAVAYKLIN